MGIATLAKHDFPSGRALSREQQEGFDRLTSVYKHLCEGFNSALTRSAMRSNIDARVIVMSARDVVCGASDERYKGNLIEGLFRTVERATSPVRITEAAPEAPPLSPGPALRLLQEPRKFFTVEALGYETFCTCGGCQTITSFGVSSERSEEEVQPICPEHIHMAVKRWMGKL
jgi:hypothetical protein